MKVNNLKKGILAFSFLLFNLHGYGVISKDSLSVLLDSTLSKKENYILQKEEKIRDIKNLLLLDNLSLKQEYDINLKLYKEYEKYISDSAILYIDKNESIAKRLENKELLLESNLYQALIYSTKGMYIESKSKLDSVHFSDLPTYLQSNYYHAFCSFYSHYGQSNGYEIYYRKSEVYRDSLINSLPDPSLEYKVEYATRSVYSNKFDEFETESLLLELLDTISDENPIRATIAYLTSEMYRQRGEIDKQEIYLMISAIADIKNSIKDNASMQSLALVYYEQEQINQAFKFMQEAINDAVSCKVRYRTIEASDSYPIINNLYIYKEKKQRHELLLYLVLISALSLILITAFLYIYRQVKKLARIRKELHQSNKTLNTLNLKLKNTVLSLEESNLIKEEYIAHFFDLYSNYIDKIEQYQKTLNKLAVNNQLQELFKTIKSNVIMKNEIEDLYKNFDSIFLNIYPTFIEDFNALLLPKERVYPKSGELLNTELRIYALIRLGIKDSVKIASFLRYSLRTVYNYRTKMRNKAQGDRDEFENLVEKIGSNQNKTD